jgi:hypothetical protein
MKAAGVQMDDALWYFNVARPRGFSHMGDIARALKILALTAKVKH